MHPFVSIVSSGVEVESSGMSASVFWCHVEYKIVHYCCISPTVFSTISYSLKVLVLLLKAFTVLHLCVNEMILSGKPKLSPSDLPSWYT